MAKLRYRMLLPELEATMRAEGGTLERWKNLGTVAIARYYRFEEELLRVDVGCGLVWQGRSYEEDDLVFSDWHVTDFYIYTPEAEERRQQENLEKWERLKWLFLDPNTPPRPSSDGCTAAPEGAGPDRTSVSDGR